MTLEERLRQLASALPSDGSAVMITRSDIVAMLEELNGETGVSSTRELTVEEVANETGRVPSTVRGWLLSGALRGYKLNNRDWRVPRSALHEYLEGQATEASATTDEVDITAWREGRAGGPPRP
jgi:excisionase family DNA binding protein